jgi:hypothetical protein
LIERVVQLTDYAVLPWIIIKVREACGAVITGASQDFDAPGNIPLAMVALYLIKEVQDILHQQRGT